MMMAMELCERATLAKWTGTLDATRRGMWTAIAKGLHEETDVGKQAIEGMAAADLAAATDRVRNTGRTGAALLPPAAHLAGGAVADKDAGEDRLAPTLLLAGNRYGLLSPYASRTTARRRCRRCRHHDRLEHRSIVGTVHPDRFVAVRSSPAGPGCRSRR